MPIDGFFYEGFDKYGEQTPSNFTTLLVMGEWSSVSSTGSSTWALATALSGDGSGKCLRLTLANNPSARSMSTIKVLDQNYKRVCGGVTFCNRATSLNQPFGIIYQDGGTTQFSITFEASGTISLRRGDDDGTVIATAAETTPLNVINCIEWDIALLNDGTANATVYMNSVPLTNLNGLTGIDLQVTATAQFNRLGFLMDHGGAVSSSRSVDLDQFYNHFYLDAADPDAGCLLTNPVIDTDFPVDDGLAVFAREAAAIGQLTRYGTSVASPAANSLILRKFTQYGDGPLTAMNMIPSATNVSAKFAGVLFADDGTGTAPGALLDTGAEVVGCTSGSTLSSDMNDVALVNGETYWIGFIMDTSLSLQLSDANAEGYRAANTYTSGAPNPAPAMTSAQGSWYMWGEFDAEENWSQLRQNPPSSRSYNSGSEVGDRDTFLFDPLTVTPAQIHGVAYKVNLRRTDAGARTMSIVVQSGPTEELSDPEAPSTSGTWQSAYFDKDPDTDAEWNASDMQAALAGYEIVT